MDEGTLLQTATDVSGTQNMYFLPISLVPGNGVEGWWDHKTLSGRSLPEILISTKPEANNQLGWDLLG